MRRMCFIVCVALCNLVFAEVHQVPSEYATIQAALDSCAARDTVLIAPGIYHEFLRGPSFSFTIMGDHVPEEDPDFWTVFDPTPLPDADTPSCLYAPTDTAIIKNIVFFNRPEYREPDWPTRTGGIECMGSMLIAENCRFDSVSQATTGGHGVTLINCDFTGCLWWCVHPNNSGSVKAWDCRFDGSGFWLVRGYTGSLIENCEFVCNTNVTDVLSFSGSDILVSNCRFGPSSGWVPVLRVRTYGNCVIEDCLFEDIELRQAVIHIVMDCPGPDGVPVTIRRNSLRNYHNNGPSVGTIGISMLCQDVSHGYFGIIEDNVFENGTAVASESPGIAVTGSATVLRNEFINLEPATRPDIWAGSRSLDTIFARNNSLSPPGLAAMTTGSYFDARENWWGDSTGPFNASSNPTGQGSQVGNDILFEPWLTMHPDSIDTSDVAIDDPISLQPIAFGLSAFPNPFNATTTLHIVVPHAADYELKLYDIRGREAAVIFRGRLQGSATLMFDAAQLPSGLYFARLTEHAELRGIAKLLALR